MIGHSFVKPLISPPGNLMVLAAVGWLIRKRRPRLGKGLMVFAAVAFYALSTPVVMQYSGQDTYIVWPAAIKTKDPVLPLPKGHGYAP